MRRLFTPAMHAAVGVRSASGDPLFSSVQLLLLPSGTEGGSPNASDTTGKALTWTGNAQITLLDATGYPAVKLDGTGDAGNTTSSYAALQVDANEPFCLEVWARVTDATGFGTLAGNGDTTFGTNGGWAYAAAHSAGYSFHAFNMAGAPTVAEAAANYGDNLYHAFCVERDSGNTLRVFLDGAVKASVSESRSLDTRGASMLCIGAEVNGGAFDTAMKGNIFAVRYTIGAHRYGGAYTPINPTQIPTS